MALTQTQVSQLYVAIFNRASEGEGNTFWQGEANVASAATAMLATTAAATYFGTSLANNEDFIEHIYLNTFNKTQFNDAAGIAYWTGLLDAGTSRGEVVAGIVAAATDAANAGAAQDQFNNRVAVSNFTATALTTAPADFATSLAFSGTGLVVSSDVATVATAQAAVTALVPGSGGGGGSAAVLLTVEQDNLVGTDGDDNFAGYIFDNQNTAQSGDVINGGAGHDSLYVDVGDSQNFAVTLHTTGVEEFAARAQAIGGDTNQNNLVSVEFDAERMDGVNHYESNNSRADVIIEDVRIEDSQITKDITIAMVQTDPGLVDFGVYFDQHSLRAAPATTAGAVLNLEIMDTRSADAGDAPLADNPFNGFAFTLDGTLYQVQSQAIDDAQTYAELLVAVQAGIAATAGLEAFTASISGTFQAIDSISGNALTGQVITLTNGGSGVLAEQGWLTDGTVPSSSAFHLVQNTVAPASTGNLITSEIILDDVGRGSMGGDLIVGGLSIGNTSTGGTSDSKGVEQFNIKVERSSELQEIQSTNNTLEEVYIVNGTANGNLVIAGNQNGDDNLPGADADGFGLTDVRIVDASALNGTADINAHLSDAVAAKYMTAVDDATSATADNIDFIYTLGKSDDTLNLTISDANLAASGTTTREDFTLVVNGGSGNDTITTGITNALGLSGTAFANWYTNSQTNANLVINGDAGNDTITTAGGGDFVINAGSGNDTVYSDNTAVQGGLVSAAGAIADSKAQWLLNAVNNDVTDIVGSGVGANSLLYKAQLTVTYSGAQAFLAGGLTAGAAIANANGFESTVEIGTTDFIGNQSNVNQAIKAAINSDAVLSKLLVATDGPASSLVITSLIDGQFVGNDLMIDVAAYTATVAELTDGSALDTAWELLNADSTLNVTQANLNAAAAVVDAALTLDLATNAFDAAATPIIGADSLFESNNVITLGNGDDVVVLTTELNSNETLVFSGNFGNDTVVNFEQTIAAYQDSLDFTAYLGGMTSASGSAESAVLVATTGDNSGTAASVLTANEVATVNDFASVVGATWASMTGANVLAAIQNDAAPTSYSNLVNASFDVATIATLVGNVQKGVIMIENDANNGEYKVFETTADNTTQEFTAVTLVGTIDFGNTVDATVAGLLV